MYLGLLIGALIGYVTLGPIGALIGAFVGYSFGRGFSGIFQAASPEQIARRQQVFFTTVFSLMGKLAKSDGRISEAEIAHTEAFMTELQLSTEHRRQAIELFKAGALGEVDAVLAEFKQVCGISPDLKHLLLVYLAGVCLADGELHSAERDLLQEIARKLGFPPGYLEQLLAMLQGQEHFSHGHYRQGAAPSDLQAAYAALGVTETASDAELKKAYRKLMSEYHPDKLMGQGVPEDMLKVATERSQEVQAAYDLIKKSRKAKG